jgi:molybdopterin molybdotransferase
MIDHEQALQAILEHVKRRPIRSTPVEDALGLALAKPVKARLRMPRFDQSAMDGIAVRVGDVEGADPAAPVALHLAGEVPAGSARTPRLRPGHAVKVYTGAPIPTGTEAVVMVERCRFEGDSVFVERAAKPGENVRRAGEEVARGDELLEAGTVITPPVVGLLALFGHETVPVRPRPRVAVITMGDEVAGPGEKLGPHQIHDANGPALRAALRGLGFDDLESWRVDDRPRSLVRALKKALGTCDVVLTAGGASVGDHDHVRAAREELGVRELFARVAIKPGKPNVFGVGPKQVPVFSLPGNPVSAMVSFHRFVRPALWHMIGRTHEAALDSASARLDARAKKKAGRLEWVRGAAHWDGDTLIARPVAAQGSHMLTGLARADALIELDREGEIFDEGSAVTLRWLRWFD